MRLRRVIALFLCLLQLLAAVPALAEDREEYDPVSGLSRTSVVEKPETGTVDVNSRLNVRDGPGLEFNIIGKLYPGDKLKILGTEKGWHKIEYQGREAWVCGYWVHSGKEDWNNPSLAPGSRRKADDGGSSDDDEGSTSGGPRTGGPLLSMPLINQNTGGGSYPSGYCGPTSVRMILAHYGINKSADEIALKNYGSGPMYTPGNGSAHAPIATALRHFGLNANLSYTRNLETLKENIRKGHPTIVNVRGNYGPFYTNGHIFVVVGFDGNNPIINDSAGGVRRTLDAATFLRTWSGLCIETWK